MGFFDFMKKKDKDDDPLAGLGSQQGSQPDQPMSHGMSQGTSSHTDPFSSQQPTESPGPYSPEYDGYHGMAGQPEQPGMEQPGVDYNPGYSPFTQDMPQQSQDQQYGYQGSQSNAREQEIILSKLDAIRTAIQNLDHRLSSIEAKLDKKDSRHDDTENIF